MTPNEILKLKLESPNTILYDKYNEGVTYTARECYKLMLQIQLIGQDGSKWAERFELKND